MPSSEKIKIIWLSANLFGYELLKEALRVKNADIGAIITLGSKTKTIMYGSIEREKWYKLGVPVYEIENINKEAELLNSLSPDFIIMAGWRQIISEEILNLPKKGFIGFHSTLLPKGRGPASIINTILLGLKKSGVTMFYLAKGIDSGDIIGQVAFNIEKDDYAVNIYNKEIEGGKNLIKRFLPLLIEAKAPRISQDNKKATYFPKRNIKDNEIKLKGSLEEIYRKIRAFSKPYCGAYIKSKNKKLIIWRADLKHEEEN